LLRDDERVHEQVDSNVIGGGRVRWTGVCIDCDNAKQLATFYCRLLGVGDHRTRW